MCPIQPNTARPGVACPIGPWHVALMPGFRTLPESCLAATPLGQ